MPSDRMLNIRAAFAGAILAAALASGCARSVAPSSVVDVYGAPEQDFEYWEGLESTRTLTNNDALHGLLILAEGTAPASFDLRLARARERGWLPESGDVLANESARTGTIAVAVCEILSIKGGLSRMIFAGRSERYCTRELVYLEYLPPRVEGQAMSGPEFLDLVTRAQRTIDERAADASAQPLPPADHGEGAAPVADDSAAATQHSEQMGSDSPVNTTNP